MTTVLTPEEIRLPGMRWPNKVIPFAVDAPVDQPYVIGQSYLNPFTPSDHYAGPAPVESAATRAFARHGAKSRKVPYMLPRAAEMACRGGMRGPIYRDFYAKGPANFWPCTRESMEQVGMNRELDVRPLPLADLGDTNTNQTVLVAVLAGGLAYWLTSKVLRSR